MRLFFFSFFPRCLFLSVCSFACRYVCYITIVSQNVGFLFFNFIVAWVFCVVGCAGCCCVIPPDPDEGDDE